MVNWNLRIEPNPQTLWLNIWRALYIMETEESEDLDSGPSWDIIKWLKVHRIITTKSQPVFTMHLLKAKYWARGHGEPVSEQPHMWCGEQLARGWLGCLTSSKSPGYSLATPFRSALWKSQLSKCKPDKFLWASCEVHEGYLPFTWPVSVSSCSTILPRARAQSTVASRVPWAG